MEKKNKEIRLEYLKKAATHLVPHKGTPPLCQVPDHRIYYVRNLPKAVITADRVALLLSDGLQYSGHQIMEACNNAWSWNQRKNDTLRPMGFEVETVPSDERGVVFYRIPSNVDPIAQTRQYLRNVADRISGKKIFKGKTLQDNKNHPDYYITDRLRRTIHYIRKTAGWDQDTYRDILEAYTGVRTCKGMTSNQAKMFIRKVRETIPGILDDGNGNLTAEVN